MTAKQYKEAGLKPYMLAEIEEPDLVAEGPVQRTVETISYPFDEDGTVKINVRLTPGLPSTIKKVDASTLHFTPWLRGKRYFVHFARVSGALTFPDDMLRYDNCTKVPETEHNNTVIVAQVSNRQRPLWTTGRWNSFGWSVTPLEDQRIELHPHH